jgi:hypothetical protein
MGARPIRQIRHRRQRFGGAAGDAVDRTGLKPIICYDALRSVGLGPRASRLLLDLRLVSFRQRDHVQPLGTDWAGALFGLGVIGAGLWGMIGWVASSLMVDHAARRLLLDRFSFWTQDNERPLVIPLDTIDAVVLTPQRRAQLLLPNRIELKLRDGKKVPVSTICSLMWGMAIQGKRLAEALGCRYEEQEEPDKKPQD